MRSEFNVSIICLTIMMLSLVVLAGVVEVNKNNKQEQIKILEQSLQEQIQEKEVYMKMLEEKYEVQRND